MSVANNRRSALASAVLMLVLVALASAPPRAQAATGSTLTGTVTVPAGANAANVHALLLDAAGSKVASSSVIDTVGVTTGTYTFTGVANGGYELYFIDPVGIDDVVPSYYGGAAGFSGAHPVTVAGDATVPVTPLGSGGEIAGLVFDANTGDAASAVEACLVGTPDPGQVAYWRSHRDGRLCADGSVASGSGGGAGSYAVGGLVPGDAYQLDYTFTDPSAHWRNDLYLEGHGVTADPGAASSYTALAGAQVIQTFSIPLLGAISGVVTNPGGQPDAAIGVGLSGTSGVELKPEVTFANGGYSIGGLLPGSYRVQFTPDSPLLAPQFFHGAATLATAASVAVGGGATTNNIGVALAQAATISGAVTAARGGVALGGITVELLDANGDQVASASTATSGQYTLKALPAGTWYLRFHGGRAYGGTAYATQYYGGSGTLAGSASVTLSAGETLIDANQAMLAQSTARQGPPVLTRGRLGGLARNRVSLRFRLTAGSGTAGYLKSFAIKLPRHVSWNKRQVRKDLVIAHDAYTEAIKHGQVVITFSSGKKVVNLRIKTGGVRVGRAVELRARARRIRLMRVQVTSTDTTGLTTPLRFTVKRPH